MHDSTPRQIKRCLSQIFGMKAKSAKNFELQWRVFALRITGNWWHAIQPVMVGGPQVPQVTIDETYWRRMLVNKHMAGRSESPTQPCWVWLACEVLRKDGVCQQQGRLALPASKLRISNIILRVIRPRNEAINDQPRGIAEITQLVEKHIQLLSFVVSDG